jgi:4-carboxymuconolactone decarboxylase
MTRMPRLVPADLVEQQRDLYDAIAAGPRRTGPFRLVEDDGSLTGPFAGMLLAPDVGAALSSLGEAIRYRSSLDARTREIVILAVAAVRRNDYEWYAHERVAAKIGMSHTELDALKHGAPPTDEPTDRHLHRIVSLAIEGAGWPADDHAWAVDRFGHHGVIEILTTVGYYTTLAIIMEAYDVGVPSGEARCFT